MSAAAVLDALLFAAEAALASTVLPLGGWLTARLYRRSASRRRLVWVTTFGVLLALPLLAAAFPSLAVITLQARMVSTPPVAAVASTSAPPSPGVVVLIAGLLAWGCGALGILARNLGGLVHLERLRRLSTPAAAGRLPLPLPRGCEVRAAHGCTGPITWGALRPVILLPEQALNWPRARLEAALRHELAHVRRRDSLIQALALIACALYWPNPLVWRAARALRDACETAADDAVIASGVRPSDYADQLLDLARDWRGRRTALAGLAMAAPPALSERVQSILSPDALRTGATPMDTLKLALMGGVAAAALVLARPSVAEVAPPAQPAPPTVAAAPLAEPAAPAPAAAPAPGPGRVTPVEQLTVKASAKPADKDAARPGLSAEQQAELDRKLAAIGPRISKALAEARIDDKAARSLAAAKPQIDAALAELGPTIQKAIADAHISEQVAKSLAAAQPEIEAAMLKAQQQAQEAQDHIRDQTAAPRP